MSSTSTYRVGVLVSGSGSNLQALIDASERGELAGVELVLVASSRADAEGLQRGLRHKIPTIYIPWRDRLAGEKRLASVLQAFEVDLIVLAGWMKIFSSHFTEQFVGKIINLHPALLPESGEGDTVTTSDGVIMPAYRGLHVVRQALLDGSPVAGSTVHFVTPHVDAGPRITFAEVKIEENDTEESLHERIKQQEHRLIVEAVRICAANAKQEQ